MFLKSFILLAVIIATFAKNCSNGQAEVLLPNNGAECVALPKQRQPVVTLEDILNVTRVSRSTPSEESLQLPEEILLTPEDIMSLTKVDSEAERVRRRSGFEECTYEIENSVTLSACMPVVIKTLKTDFGTVTIIEIGEEALKRARSTAPTPMASKAGEEAEIAKRDTSSSLGLAMEMELIQAEMEASMASHKSVKRTMSQEDTHEEPGTCLMKVENNTVTCTDFTVVKRSTPKGTTMTMVEIPSAKLSADDRKRLSGTVDEKGNMVIVEMVSNDLSSVSRPKREAEESTVAPIAPVPAVFPDNVITARLLASTTAKPLTIEIPVEEGN